MQAGASVIAIWIASICSLAACEHVEDPPARTCFADKLGKLDPVYHVVKGCTATDVACRDACDKGDRDACINRAFAVEEPQDNVAIATSHALFFRACKEGLALACTNWAAGEMYDGDSDSRCVRRVFQRSCESGDSFGCGMAGRMMFDVFDPAFGRPVGELKLIAACTDVGGPPCRFLAYYLELGELGAADPSLIAPLMKRACDGLDQDACGEHATVRETLH